MFDDTPITRASDEPGSDHRLAGSPLRVLAISSLSLHHFRNYVSARVEISSASVVLTGRNGAGKTNILEALSLLTPGRGLRRARLAEMDHSPSPCKGEGSAWAISATAAGRQGAVKIGTGREAGIPVSEENGNTRLVKIDGKIMRGQAELARHLAVLWLTPQMEQLFQDGASAGRKFLDRLVYSFDPEHASRVNAYEQAMRERNKLLLQTRPNALWLDALEQGMAAAGAAIAQGRLHTAEHINDAARRSPLSFPKAHIAVIGASEERLAAGAASIEVEEALARALKAGRGQDAAAGRALAGVHRSELRVTHIAKNMPASLCSTGEQKALLLSIVLAQARAGAQWHGAAPVLLLDEVVAHLDAHRRRELFEEIGATGAQAWMTGTDSALFAGLEGKAQFFQVDNGVITA